MTSLMILFHKTDSLISRTAKHLTLLKIGGWIAVFTVLSPPLMAQLADNTAIWNGGGDSDQSWNNTANWTFGIGQNSTLAPHLQIASNLRNARFNNSANVALAENVSTPATNNMTVINLSNGSIVFDLAGFTLRSNSWTLGDGAGNTSSVVFKDTTNSGASVVGITNLVLGANGSSGNIYDSSLLFNGVTSAGPTGSVTIGSTGGGRNNVFRVNSGETVSLTGTLAFNSGGTTGRSQNRVDVNGGILGLTNNLNIQGNGTMVATTDGETYDNQFLIRDEGIVNFQTGTSNRTITVGGGSELRIIEGSAFNTSGTMQTNITVTDKGLLLIDNSTFNKTGNGTFIIAGGTVVRNQSTINNGRGVMTVSATGRLAVDDSIFTHSNSFSAFSQTALTIQGLLEVTNGSEFTGTYTSTTTGGTHGEQSSFLVASGGSVLVEGGSSFSINNNLSLKQGSKFEIKGNSSASVGIYSMLDSSSATFVNGMPTVETGSSFRFEKLGLANTKYMESQGFGNSYENVLSSTGGLLILGTGGFQTGLSSGRTDANLTLAAGTRLRLDGDVTTEYNLNGGYMRIREGAVLEGTGSWKTQNRFENLGLINPGKNDGVNGEAGTFTFDHLVEGNMAFDIFGTTDGTYDQILFSAPNNGGQDFALTVNVQDKQDGALDDLSIGQEYALFREGISGGEINLDGPDNIFTFDFSQSGEVLAARGLGWNTSDFASTGILKLQEVARLEFTDATTNAVLPVGATVTDGQSIKITNKAFESFGAILGEGKDATILSKEVSNSGFSVTGLNAGTEIEKSDNLQDPNPTYHSTTGTVAFQNRSQALNGTHKAKLTLEVDHDTDDTEVAPVKHTIHLNETVTGNVAAAGQTYRAYVDAGDGFGGFSLTNNSLGSNVGTVASLKGGAASAATMLQMSFTALGDVNTGPEGPQFFSDVVNLQGTGSDTYVLSMTYDVDLYGALGEDAEAPMLAWFDNTSANMDDWEWVNAVLGNIGESTPTFYEGAWQEDYDLGAYGWDATTNSVWAVLNHNSQFGVIESGLVPEPSRMLLVALGTVTLMFRRRRRSAPAAC